MLKKDFESQNFAIFEEVVHNFLGLTMTSICEKMLISSRCLRGLMPNLIKKSVTVSNAYRIKVAYSHNRFKSILKENFYSNLRIFSPERVGEKDTVD